MKKLILTTFFLFFCIGTSSEIFAQRKTVGGAEVTGTFRSYFKGKFKGWHNEILIQALGKNKLKIEMHLFYPFEVNGETDVNFGSPNGEAVITGDTAIFVPTGDADIFAPKENRPCKITLKFSKPGTLIVTSRNPADCQFGLNVVADGTYKKSSGAKPKFGANPM